MAAVAREGLYGLPLPPPAHRRQLFGFEFFQVVPLDFFGGAGRPYSMQGIVRVWFRKQGSGAKIIWEYDGAGGTACASCAQPGRMRSSTTCWTWYETEPDDRMQAAAPAPSHPPSLSIPQVTTSTQPSCHVTTSTQPSCHKHYSPCIPMLQKLGCQGIIDPGKV